MITSQELLAYQLKSLQRIQFYLHLSEIAAASHALKSTISDQITKLDQLETQQQILSTQRGWDVHDLQPLSKWFISLRYHCRSDSSISENLIYLYTDSIIAVRKRFYDWNQDDAAVSNSFQKLIDCLSLGIRQMESHL